VRLRSREFYKINREEKQAYQRRYREENLEKVRASQRRYREDNPEKVRATYLKCVYGLDLLQYNKLLEKQNGGCAVCGGSEKIEVDHCHQTGVVRGLLCTNCNKSLGGFKDSIQSLRAAIRYLQNPPAQKVLNNGHG